MTLRQMLVAIAAASGLLLHAAPGWCLAAEEALRVDVLARQATERTARAEFAAAKRDLDEARSLASAASLPEAPATASLDLAFAGWYEAMGDYRRAAESARSALAARKRLLGDEHPETLASANHLAFLQFRFGDLKASERDLAKVLEARRRTLGGAHPDVAESENDLAFVLGLLRRSQESRALYDSALAIREAKLGPDHPLTATVRFRRAGTATAFGRFSEAAPDADEALRIRRKFLGERHPATAQAYQMVAEIAGYQGRLDDAERQGRIALEIITEAYGEGHPEVARILNNQYRFWFRRGELGTALATIERALDISRRTLGTDNLQTATMLQNHGEILQLVGSPRAEQAFLESLQIRERKLGFDHPEVADSLGKLAGCLLANGRPSEALPLLARAMEIIEKAGMSRHPNAGNIYRRLGQAQKMGGDLASAEASYRQALDAVRATYGSDTEHAAVMLMELALVCEAKGDFTAARSRFQEALLLSAKGTSQSELAWGYHDYARFLHRRGEVSTAIFFGKQAINAWQRSRGSLSLAGAQTQREYASKLATRYRFVADLLVSEGRIAEAEETLGLLKLDEYAEFTRSSGADRRTAAMTGAEHDADGRLTVASANVVRLSRELEGLRRRSGGGMSESDTRRRDSLEDELARARRAFDAFLNGLYDEFAAASPERNRELGERQLDRLNAMRGTLRELGKGVVLVHYLVAESRVAIIVTTPTAQVARDSPIEEARLNRLVRDFRRALQLPGSEIKGPSRELHRVLIAPIAKDLEDAGARVLMLSLDGVLRYAPFAALHDGERFLVEQFETVLYTEAARDKLKDRPGRDWRIAGLGVTKGIGGFEPLPAVKDELEGIRGAILPGEIWLDADFTADRLGDLLARGYPLLHVASHFRFRPGTEADSFLLLGDGSRLSLRQVRQQSLDFASVDLITLSACETGTGGGREENGREVEGFGALVQNLGAKGVIATLWSVADRSTGEFMKELYRSRQSNATMTKAAALRQAQLLFLRGVRIGEVSGTPSSKTGDGIEGGSYAHPFHWAPFILMGNWL